jgi:hypothetical protein
MHAELIVPEVGLSSSGCDDQGVVGDLSAPADRFERHTACVQVHVDHVAEQHARIGVAAEDVPDRWGDVALGHDAGRHLVEQRLEEVMVGAVDHGYVDRSVPQGLRGGQAAEARADYDDPVPRLRCAHGAPRRLGWAFTMPGDRVSGNHAFRVIAGATVRR